MKVVINVHYRGDGDSARRFVEDMVSEGVLERVRAEGGCLGYEYFASMEDPGHVLLVEHWEDESALDAHSRSDNMAAISSLKNRYALSAEVERNDGRDGPGRRWFLRAWTR